MKDKKGTTFFIRTLDRAHRANVRIVVPPFIDKFLGNADKVGFHIVDGHVLLSIPKYDDEKNLILPNIKIIDTISLNVPKSLTQPKV